MAPNSKRFIWFCETEYVAAHPDALKKLRDEIGLTGTHLGCEHGICGACTVLIDGQMSRSCITYAISCDGATVETIEGVDDDPVMKELRRAFSEEHALQCGYCTPGMLITARAILSR